MPKQTQKTALSRMQKKHTVNVRGNTPMKKTNLGFIVNKAEGAAICVTCVIEHAQPHLVVTLHGIRMDSFKFFKV